VFKLRASCLVSRCSIQITPIALLNLVIFSDKVSLFTRGQPLDCDSADLCLLRSFLRRPGNESFTNHFLTSMPLGHHAVFSIHNALSSPLVMVYLLDSSQILLT
jgi:hypothetical protein